jgi:hypothetical protein
MVKYRSQGQKTQQLLWKLLLGPQREQLQQPPNTGIIRAGTVNAADDKTPAIITPEVSASETPSAASLPAGAFGIGRNLALGKEDLVLVSSRHREPRPLQLQLLQRLENERMEACLLSLFSKFEPLVAKVSFTTSVHSQRKANTPRASWIKEATHKGYCGEGN